MTRTRDRHVTVSSRFTPLPNSCDTARPCDGAAESRGGGIPAGHRHSTVTAAVTQPPGPGPRSLLGGRSPGPARRAAS
eukprot:337145-Hanusia_phi.AAC.1